MEDSIIVYIMVYISEYIILLGFIKQIYRNNEIKWKRVLTVLGMIYTILFLVSVFEEYLLNIAAFTITHVLFFSYIMKEKKSVALFYTIIIFMCMGIGELAVLNATEYYAASFYRLKMHESSFIIIAVFSKVIYFAVLQIFIIIYKHMPAFKRADNAKTSLVAMPVLIASVWGMTTLFVVSMSVELPEIPGRMVAVCAILFFLTDFLFVWIESVNVTAQEEIANYRFMKLKENYLTDYYKAIKEHDESQRILVHDIKEHIQTIREMNMEDNRNGIEEYILSIYELPALKRANKVCERDLLNALITRYGDICKEKRISFGVDITEDNLDFLNDRDIVGIFTNLLNNSIEASEGVSGAYIDLRVKMLKSRGQVMISVSNKYEGKREKNGELFVSTKSLGVEHGYGLKSVRKIVREHEGIMDVSAIEEDHCFHVNILFNNH